MCIRWLEYDWFEKQSYSTPRHRISTRKNKANSWQKNHVWTCSNPDSESSTSRFMFRLASLFWNGKVLFLHPKNLLVKPYQFDFFEKSLTSSFISSIYSAQAAYFHLAEVDNLPARYFSHSASFIVQDSSLNNNISHLIQNWTISGTHIHDTLEQKISAPTAKTLQRCSVREGSNRKKWLLMVAAISFFKNRSSKLPIFHRDTSFYTQMIYNLIFIGF